MQLNMRVVVGASAALLVAELAGIAWFMNWMLGDSPNWMLVAVCGFVASVIVVLVLSAVIVAARADEADDRGKSRGAQPLSWPTAIVKRGPDLAPDAPAPMSDYPSISKRTPWASGRSVP